MKARSRTRSSRVLAPLAIVLVAAILPFVATPDGAAGQTVLDLGAVMVPTSMPTAQTEFVPAAETALLQLLNRTRGQHGLPPLVMNGVLRNTARSHSREMALGGFIGHGSPSSGAFLERHGGVLRPGDFVGENVAYGGTIAQVEAAFEASRGHLENMLDPRFRSVGIGIATAAAGLLVTEDFAG
ncbi:MAG TPA: CAP domain-containing protein [bacterium]|nr:CAP domain-containing protein [bacterium]